MNINLYRVVRTMSSPIGAVVSPASRWMSRDEAERLAMDWSAHASADHHFEVWERFTSRRVFHVIGRVADRWDAWS